MFNKVINWAKGSLKDPKMIVTRETDPDFFVNFGLLPNPDSILAKMGKDQSVFTAMQYDPHVMGEIQSLRGGLLSYERRIVPGGDDPESMRAYEVIKEKMNHRPVADLTWDDFLWNIYTARLNGQSIYEVAMQQTDDNYIFPAVMVDRPVRRFRYSMKNELRFLTKNSPLFGEDAPDDYRFLVTKHMPSHDNPYGVAIYSSIFWAHVFKHGGMKWMAKLAEKWGIPFLIGRYPIGTEAKQQNELAQQLQQMVEDAVAAIPEGSGVEALEYKVTGDPIQERLINLCNREISKALTSQSLGAEILGNGSRAAADSSAVREDKSAHKPWRTMVCSTVDELFSWITALNFKNAKPPHYELYKADSAPTEWMGVFSKMDADVPEDFYYNTLKIPQPKEGQKVISLKKAVSNAVNGEGSFARADSQKLTGMGVDSLLKPVTELLERMDKDGKTLDEFHDALFTLFPDIDDSSVSDYMVLALSNDYLKGMVVEDR